jgi:DNA-binding transcriptional regulator LsrR (DeoR family)
VRRAIDDAQAVARARDGDLDAYGVLVARYTLRAHRAAFLLGAGERIRKVAGVAGGLHKTAAILDALHGGFLDVLVASELAAIRLLELERRRPGP